MSQLARSVVATLEGLLGPANVLIDDAEISPRQVDGMRPSVVVRPANAAEIAEVVRFAIADKLTIIPSGGCTKLGIGSPPSCYDIALDVTRMNRVLAYDPHDLTLGVEPGIRIAELLRILAEQKQFLPLSVPFFDRATVGGLVAANSTSPLRHSYGGIRDFCLGMEFVTGEGAIAKSGGRVVKNVTGYDLHKLLIGSLGTLAVITRINFRTYPLAPACGTFVTSFTDGDPAMAFCRAIAHSVLTPQLVELVDPGASQLLFSADGRSDIPERKWFVVVTAAGQPAVVDRHNRELLHLANAGGAVEFIQLSDGKHATFEAGLREFPRLVLEAAPLSMIFRIGTLPSVLAPLLVRLGRLADQANLNFAAIGRASGILIAAFLPKKADSVSFETMAGTSNKVFEVCNDTEISAQAMLENCPTEMKSIAPGVWGPARGDVAVMQRVKKAFDPENVFSPGRFVGMGQ